MVPRGHKHITYGPFTKKAVIKMIEKFDKFVRGINKVMDTLLVIDMLVMFVILMLQIISRFVAFFIIDWTQDLLCFLLVASVYLGVCSATYMGKQIRLEFFVDLFPKRVADIILCVADVISIIYLAIICKDAATLALDNISIKLGTSIIPYGYYYVTVVIGFIGMIFNFINLILKRIPSITGKEAA